MDEELELYRPEPKISEVEIILIGLFVGLLDLIDIIPIAGDITDIVAAPLGFYFFIKGINGVAFFIAELLDLIPGIQALPSRTVSWVIITYLDRHPKQLALLEKGAAIAGVLEGNVEEGGQSAAATEERTAGADSRSRTLEMTRSEDGTFEYQPNVEADAAAPAAEAESPRPGMAPASAGERGSAEETEGSNDGAQQQRRIGARPSDVSTERGSEENADEGNNEDKDKTGQTYDDLMTSEAERNPVDVAKEAELGDEVPIQRNATPELSPENKKASGRFAEKIDSQKRLEDRWAERQAKFNKAA